MSEQEYHKAQQKRLRVRTVLQKRLREVEAELKQAERDWNVAKENIKRGWKS